MNEEGFNNFQSNLPPESGKAVSEAEKEMTPEAIQKQNNFYTVEGSRRIIEFVKAVEVGEIGPIQIAVERAAAYMEGLYNGVEASRYNLNSKRLAVKLMNQFTTVEDSTNRRNINYLLMAIREGLTNAVEETYEYEEDPVMWLEQQEARALALRKAESMNRVNNLGLEAYSSDLIDKLVMEDLTGEATRIRRLISNRETLLSLDEHLEHRVLLFDQAFIQRQRACNDEEAQVNLSKSPLQPEKGHWMAYYQGNAETENEVSPWGTAVSKTERAILQIARGEIQIEGMTPEDSRKIYLNGFRTAGEFTSWVKALLPYTKIGDTERMDVLWNAWKMCLWKEEITRVAWGVDDKGKYVFGNPPLTTDLMVKMIHNDKNRAMEYGWNAVYKEDENYRWIVDLDASEEVEDEAGNKHIVYGKLLKERKETREVNGKKKTIYTGDYVEEKVMTKFQFDRWVDSQTEEKRTKEFKAISHSGHPLSIGKVGRLVDALQHRINVKDKNLYEIWMKDGMEFSDLAFPWATMDIPTGDEEPGEYASGSVGGWQLAWVRGSKVREMLRTIPTSRESNMATFEKVLRNWEKIKKIAPGKLLDGEPTNPVAWYFAGGLFYGVMYAGGIYEGTPRGYKPQSLQNRFVSMKAGAASEGEIATYDVISNLYNIGAISEEEFHWFEGNIIQKL